MKAEDPGSGAFGGRGELGVEVSFRESHKGMLGTT